MDKKKNSFKAKAKLILWSSQDKEKRNFRKSWTPTIYQVLSPEPIWLKQSRIQQVAHPITKSPEYRAMRAEASNKVFVPLDFAQGKRLLEDMYLIYEKDCDGYVFFLLGFVCKNRRQPQADQHFKTAFQKLLGATDAESLYALGFIYLNGLGPLDSVCHEAALYFYQRAALLGHTVAINDLGYMYRTGSGVMQDYALALHFYRKAADRGDALSQYNTATMYLRGWGLAGSEPQLAMEYFGRSAKQGDLDAKKEYENLAATLSKGG